MVTAMLELEVPISLYQFSFALVYLVIRPPGLS